MSSKDTFRLGVCALAAVFSAVTSTDNEFSETLMAGVRVKEELFPGEKLSNESESVLFSLSNHGVLENGLANLNLMQSVELQEAFRRVRDLTEGRVNCKAFTSPSIVVYKFCPLNGTTTEVAGSYSSDIKIARAIRYTARPERVIHYMLSVSISATMRDANTKYERCPIDTSWLEQQYSRQQTLSTIKYGNKHEKAGKVFEFIMPNVHYITMVLLREWNFLRVVLTELPKAGDMINDECHNIEQQKQDTLNIKPQKCRLAGNQKRKIKKNFNKFVSMTFEENREKFTMAVHDESDERHRLNNAHQGKFRVSDSRYLELVGFSKTNIPKKVTYEEVSNGKLFSFSFDESEEMSAHQLLLFVQDNGTRNDSGNLEQAYKGVEKVQKSNPTEKKNEPEHKDALMITGNTSVDHLINAKVSFNEIPTVCTKTQLTCGVVTMEMARQKILSPRPLTSIPHLTTFQAIKIKINQNGNELEIREKKFLQRRLSFIKGKKEHHAAILEMIPEFMGRVKRMIIYIKRLIASKFGANVWKNFVFSSELMITRRLVCGHVMCCGTIKATLKYNVKPMTQKLPTHTPKGIYIRLALLYGRQQRQRKQQQHRQLQHGQQTQHQKRLLRQEPKYKADNNSSKILFRPGVIKGDEKLRNTDVLSKTKADSPRHFKADKRYLHYKEKLTDDLDQTTKGDVKMLVSDLESINEEQKKILKERTSTSSELEFNHVLTCTLAMVLNCWLLMN